MLKYLNKNNSKSELFAYLDYRNGLPQLGIGFAHGVMYGNNSEVKKKLISIIEDEQMLLLKVDTSKIHYDIVFSRNEQTFHSFNVIAYDCENDSFCISDSFIPAYEPFSKQLWITADELIMAWDNCREYGVVTFCDDRSSIVINTNEKVIKQLEWYLNGGHEDNVYYGCTAIRQLIVDFKKGVLDEWNIQNVIDFNFQLRVNGFYMGREYLNAYIDKLSDKHLSIELLEIINHWKKNNMALTKCVMRKKEDRFIQIIDEMNVLCDAEESIFRRIKESIKEYE
jgi:hypothetical protein